MKCSMYRLRLCRRQPPSRKVGSSLATLVQSLELAKATADAIPIPGLRGAVGIAWVIADSVHGDQSNDTRLQILASACGDFMVHLTNMLLSNFDGLSDEVEAPLARLSETLEEVEKFTTTFARTNLLWRITNHAHARDTIEDLYRQFILAQSIFQTVLSIKHMQSARTLDYKIYLPDTIDLADPFQSGDGWEAFTATLLDSGESVLVKRYTSQEKCRRKLMYAKDRVAFMTRWYPNLIAFLGGNPSNDNPFIVFRGVTSEYVSSYIAQKLNQDNRHGSVEALKLLSQLTGAVAHIAATSDSAVIDISKVHLNNSGRIVVVDLQPSLAVGKEILSKNNMPHWCAWRRICIELLSGHPDYEPNPAIEHVEDPSQHYRLTYPRPILGHIHSGGSRSRDLLPTAFRKQTLILDEARNRLHPGEFGAEMPQRTTAQVEDRIFQPLWRGSRQFQYVAHFHEPLDVKSGDIGYVTESPELRFVRLANVQEKIWEGYSLAGGKTISLLHEPQGRWTTHVVEGIVRHTFSFCPSDAMRLQDWQTERPRINKEFSENRINYPNDDGLVVDCSRAWQYLEEHQEELASLASIAEHKVQASDLILVVYNKERLGYAAFRKNKQHAPGQWGDIWRREGLETAPDALYFYDSPQNGRNGTWGYFSFSPTPGTPHPNWTPKNDDEGEDWGWTFVSDDWTVEISKLRVKQYIRYVQL